MFVSFKSETEAKESITKAITFKNCEQNTLIQILNKDFQGILTVYEPLGRHKSHFYMVMLRYRYRSNRFKTILMQEFMSGKIITTQFEIWSNIKENLKIKSQLNINLTICKFDFPYTRKQACIL